MYSIASEWALRVNVTCMATVVNGKIVNPIQPIEPDTLFTSNTIAIYVSSQTGKPSWYRGGNLYQAFLVPFGTAGYAQGEKFSIVLNRYQVFRFTKFPDLKDNKYLISFTAPDYFQDVSLKVWEYVGANQGASLEDLESLIKSNITRVSGLQTSINKLLKRIK